MDTITVFSQKIHDLRKLKDNIPVTFQQLPQSELRLENETLLDRDYTMTLEMAQEAAKTALDDYNIISKRKPTTDLKKLNENKLDEEDYLQRRVPNQLDQLMFYIEALIHREDFDERNFGAYKEIHRSALGLTGWERARKLVRLCTCFTWAVPQNKYYVETEVIDPMFGSASRTTEVM